MNIEQIVSYLIATAIIVAIPGPNILLIIHDSMTHGFRKSAMTTMGITMGMALLFSLSLAGIATLLLMFSWLFFVMKWIGAAYLFYLGIVQIAASFNVQHMVHQPVNDKRHFFAKGFLISATNPKGLLFAGAFFPQFLNPDAAMLPQVAILCGGALMIGLIIGLVYAFFCDMIGKAFRSISFQVIVKRISGIFLIFFGIGLAFAKEK